MGQHGIFDTLFNVLLCHLLGHSAIQRPQISGGGRMNNYIIVNAHHKQPYDFYCGRPKAGSKSPLGNPYKHDAGGLSVVEQFRFWLWNKIKTGDPEVIAELKRIRAHGQANAETKLACWCVPHRECHVEIIVKALLNPGVITILDAFQSDEQGLFPDIRGLTLLRPWPWAFLNGPEHKQKRVENRTWHPPKGTDWIALHSGKGWDASGFDFIHDTTRLAAPADPDHPSSQIFAICRLEGVFELRPEEGINVDFALVDPSISLWAFGPYCWVLSDFVPLVNPIVCSGAQGLWKVSERTGLMAQIEKAYLESIKVHAHAIR